MIKLSIRELRNKLDSFDGKGSDSQYFIFLPTLKEPICKVKFFLKIICFASAVLYLWRTKDVWTHYKQKSQAVFFNRIKIRQGLVIFILIPFSQ